MARVFFTLFAFLLSLTTFAAAEVTRYSGTLRLEPTAGRLSADLVVAVTARDKELAQDVFYLNKGLSIESVRCDRCSGYSFDVSKTHQVQFVEHGVPLTVTFKRPLKPGEQVAIRLRYSGSLVPDRFGVNLLTPKWTELGMYSSWYPYHKGSGAYTFDLRVKTTDPALKVSGNAEVSGSAGNWRLVETEPTSDMIVVAAPNMTTRNQEVGGLKLRIDSAGASDAAVEQLARDAADMVAHYTRWYGPANLRNARFVLNPRPTGGGYVRPRFMSLPYSADQMTWLAHEIGHFWWTGAQSDNWEDWLNESFAEYSSVRYVRELKGEKDFDSLVQVARKRSTGKPAIWGISRDDRNAHDVLYDKGVLRLLALEELIGQEKFNNFLATLHREKVKNTAALLQVLEKQTTPEVRQKFEGMLKEQ